MPRPLAAKAYPSLFTVYTRETTQDPDTGSSVTAWNYDRSTAVFRCNVFSARPESNLESFGTTYRDSEFIRIETPAPGTNFDLSMRVGNLRSASGEGYYLNRLGVPLVFDIDGLSTRIDLNGNRVCAALFCRLAASL